MERGRRLTNEVQGDLTRLRRDRSILKWERQHELPRQRSRGGKKRREKKGQTKWGNKGGPKKEKGRQASVRRTPGSGGALIEALKAGLNSLLKSETQKGRRRVDVRWEAWRLPESTGRASRTRPDQALIVNGKKKPSTNSQGNNQKEKS